MQYKILIKNDLFNISKRIKRIDKNYFILYNKKNGKFEVHNSSQKFSTLSLVSPFENLDVRLLDLINKTRVELSVEIFKEIDKNNNKIEKSNDENRNLYCQDKFREIFNYSNNSSKDFKAENSYKNVWL